MNRVPFNEAVDLAFLPFNRRVLASARSLKALGLEWRPHVGCFVWDHRGSIPLPSPFPLNVYFVLSQPRFSTIFGNMEALQSELVWVPTWHQALELCRRMGLSTADVLEDVSEAGHSGDEVLLLYQRIANTLMKQRAASTEPEER